MSRQFRDLRALSPLAFGNEQVYLTFVLLCRRMAMAADRSFTRISTKGQVVVPRSIRRRRRWEAGTRLIIEDTADGVVLRTAPAFAATMDQEVYGVLKFSGPPKTVEEMNAGVLVEARRHNARD